MLIAHRDPIATSSHNTLLISRQPGLSPYMSSMGEHARLGPPYSPKTLSDMHRNVPAACGNPPPSRWTASKQPPPNVEHSKHWMAKFCVEPPHSFDVNTCCLGWWVPSVLYGKTHWRLQRLIKNKDPLDSSWKADDGCNKWCGIYLALDLIGYQCKYYELLYLVLETDRY
jgi:hypothetical protein